MPIRLRDVQVLPAWVADACQSTSPEPGDEKPIPRAVFGRPNGLSSETDWHVSLDVAARLPYRTHQFLREK